ncbi:hypothetical protein EDB87DRAFT_1576933 [Lactarius vividus]|nr:hypothetical protein EDB87DRAFT_1576933 [Lactarius vividus]
MSRTGIQQNEWSTCGPTLDHNTLLVTSRLLRDKKFTFEKVLGGLGHKKMLGGHAQYFATLGVAEQTYDALITWDLIGELQVTDLSLKNSRQFDQNKLGRADNPLVAVHTPDDYVLPMAMDGLSPQAHEG